jgi:hypothetical protein
LYTQYAGEQSPVGRSTGVLAPATIRVDDRLHRHAIDQRLPEDLTRLRRMPTQDRRPVREARPDLVRNIRARRPDASQAVEGLELGKHLGALPLGRRERLHGRFEPFHTTECREEELAVGC